jgi:steroid delta-isomerase-like uncharacterized protein
VTTLFVPEPAIAPPPPIDPDRWGTSSELTAEERRNLATMSQVEPCWNRRDVAAILEHYDDGIVWRNMAMGETYRGKDEVGRFLTDLFVAVPDLQMHITRRIPRGSLVAEEYTLRGTHLGALFGIPATGCRVELHAVSFVEMRDGRLAEDHFYFDVTGILQQLGLFPSLRIAQTTLGHLLVAAGVVLRWPVRSARARRAGRRRG